jgi:hypothetical protein
LCADGLRYEHEGVEHGKDGDGEHGGEGAADYKNKAGVDFFGCMASFGVLANCGGHGVSASNGMRSRVQ